MSRLEIVTLEEVAEEIISLSQDGIAPSSKEHWRLSQLVRRKGKKWSEFCLEIGLASRYGNRKPREKQVAQNSKNAPKESNDAIKKLFAVLCFARKHTDSAMAVNVAFEAVMQGHMDRVDLVLE